MFQDFTCTTPRPKLRRAPWQLKHPRPWELRLQGDIRTTAASRAPTEECWVGCDYSGMGATFRLRNDNGPAEVFIVNAAIAKRLRGQDRSVAAELGQRMLSTIDSNAAEAGIPQVVVTAHTHEQNRGAQRLAEELGFGRTDKSTDVLVWQLRLDIPAIDA